MNAEISNRNFTGTNIKSPMEKMRATAIIRAKDDATGLSMINFNITTFLPESRHEDAFFILGAWATEPVRRSPDKFIRFPDAGKKALAARSNALMARLLQRDDVDKNFIDAAKVHIKSMIAQDVTYLCQNQKSYESA